MSRHVFMMAVFLLLLSAPTSASAESTDAAEASADVGHLLLSNRTNSPIIFYMETARIGKTEYQLPANSSATFTGAPGDSWFNIYVLLRVEFRRDS
jgi:hypothetical protein